MNLRRYKFIHCLVPRIPTWYRLPHIAMAGPRKISPVVRTYLKSSRSGVQARIYSRKDHLDKTAVGQDLEQALKRLKQDLQPNRKMSK